MVLALINTVFAQETQEAAIMQCRAVADQLRTKFPKLALALLWKGRDSLGSLVFSEMRLLGRGYQS